MLFSSQTYLGDYAFLPFGAMALLEFIFMGLFLPETCGVPVEKIVQGFTPGHSLVKVGFLCKNDEEKDTDDQVENNANLDDENIEKH